MSSQITAATIKQAAQQISKFIHKTPMLKSETINKLTGSQIAFKCENLQKTGSFKVRGAANALLEVMKQEKNPCVVAHSSGNHASAMAKMSRLFGMEAHIVMPKDNPVVKRQYVLAQKPNLYLSGSTMKEREAMMKEIVKETGAQFISSSNDYRVIAGAATCTYEIIKENEEKGEKPYDYIITPIGGGGLVSGACLSSKYFSPSTKIIGVEPYLARDAYLSLKTGKMQPQFPPKTIAEGLTVSLGKKTFEIMKQHLNEILIVQDEEVAEASVQIWQIMKIICETSSATVLAAILNNQEKFKNKKVAAILSGGNVDLESIAKYKRMGSRQTLFNMN